MKTPDRKNRKIKIAFIPVAGIIWVFGWSLTFFKSGKNPQTKRKNA
jgi:hypothetical protein